MASTTHTRFANEVDQELAEFLKVLESAESIEKYRLKPRDAQPLYDAIQEIARRGQFDGAIELLRAPTKLINAMAIPGFNKIIVSDGLLKLYDSQHLHLPPTPEMKWVLAHEIGHLKQGLDKILTARYTPLLALPAAAVGAMALYDKAQARAAKKKTEATPENLAQEIREITASYERRIGAQHGSDSDGKESIDAQWKKTLLRSADYLAAAALGVAGGLALTRHNMLKLEYDADRFGMMTTGSVDAFVSAINKLYDMRALKTPAASKQATTFTGRLADIVKRECESVLTNCLHAHPSRSQRIQAVQREFGQGM
jgi:Zn-dependent protease with chaperone function